jgi:hypothetical protein
MRVFSYRCDCDYRWSLDEDKVPCGFGRCPDCGSIVTPYYWEEDDEDNDPIFYPREGRVK